MADDPQPPDNRPLNASEASEISISRVVADLPASIAVIFRRLLHRPRLSREEMKRRISTYVVEIESWARRVDYIDVELVQSIANRCYRLIDGVDVRSTEEHRRLVQAAVEYFLIDEDAESDTGSLIGFDDDRLVVDAVWHEVGARARAD